MNRPELRQRIIEILVKPLKVPYQQDAAEMMVQGAINQAEEILALIDEEMAQRELLIEQLQDDIRQAKQ